MENRNNYSAQVDPKALDIWNHAYPEIVEEFGFSRYFDVVSAILLNRLYIASRPLMIDLSRYMGKKSVVLGPAASKVNISDNEVVIVADSALSRLEDLKRVDFTITDLDADPEKLLEVSNSGSIMVVHAHGDNIDRLVEFFPSLKGRVIISCQTEALGKITDFGGFTDGDRAVFFAHFLRSTSIRIVGFDFEKPVAKRGSDLTVKKKKLKWSRSLIDQLKQHRVKEFGSNNITFQQ